MDKIKHEDIKVYQSKEDEYTWEFNYKGIEYSGSLKFSKDEKGLTETCWDKYPLPDFWEDAEEEIMSAVCRHTDPEALKFIKKVYTEHTGGGCMVDFVVLKSGKMVSITKDCICLYDSVEDFWNHEKQPKTIIMN